MITTIKTAPVLEPVTLTDVKNQLRIAHDFNDEDAYLSSLITVARLHIEDLTRRKFITQTWYHYRQNWPDGDSFELPYGNLQSVTAITYQDSDNTTNTFSSSDYIVDTDSDPGRVVLGYGEVWPGDTLLPSNPIKTEFVCGYGDSPSSVPQPLKHAILILINEMYDNRELTVTGKAVTKIENATYRALWFPYVIYRL